MYVLLYSVTFCVNSRLSHEILPGTQNGAWKVVSAPQLLHAGK